MIDKTKIAVALIHNNNETRNSIIRPHLTALINRSPLIEGPLIDISHQHEVSPQGNLMAFTRDIMYQSLSRRWKQYRLLPAKSRVSEIFRFTKKSIRKHVFNYRDEREISKKLGPIEGAVTDKHIRAWTTFLDTDSSYLLCFEDDATFKQDSIEDITDLSSILDTNKEHLLYLDLAGGCALDTLKINKLQISHDTQFRHYSKGTTNTACVYLMSRPLVGTFHSILTQKPWLRLLAVDLMMNNLFTIMEGRKIQTKCMHADPVFFEHGSTTGDCTSWYPGH